MAESQKSTEMRPAEPKPVLVAKNENIGSPSPRTPAERKTPATSAPAEKRSNTLSYVLLLLLAGAVIAAAIQTQRHTVATERITALGDRVLGLEVQLSAASLQIQTYELQRNEVSQAVSDIAERVTLLQELVASDPADPGSDTLPLDTP